MTNAKKEKLETFGEVFNKLQKIDLSDHVERFR